MNGKRLLFLGVLLLAVFVFPFAQANNAFAVGVNPIEITGNPSCTDLNLRNEEFPGITTDFGFKIEGQITGASLSFNLISGSQNGYNTELTGNAPADEFNTITITNSDGTIFDWIATLGIDAVIVKGGNSANSYVYLPEAFSDEDLTTPDGENISHVEFCYDYELTVAKDADTEWTRDIDWDIVKDVTPPSANQYIGEQATFDYTVSVTKVVTETFMAYGNIYIDNTTPYTVEFTIADNIDGIPATVTCQNTLLSPGESVICTYEAYLPDATQRTNVATVISNHMYVQGGSAEADVIFGDAILPGEPDNITVNDTNGESWTTSTSNSWTYNEVFTCSTNLNDYDKGKYTFDHLNTAKIKETGDSDSEKVTVNCYAPMVDKDAKTSYTRTYDWMITKKVAPSSHMGYAGDNFTSNYTVTVKQQVTNDNFFVFGTITVENPGPRTIIVAVADKVDGMAATLDCDGTLEVPPQDSATCGYTAALDTKTDGTNTATVTFNSIDFPASAAYAFGEPTRIIGYPDITVDDTNLDPVPDWSASGDMAWYYPKDFLCPTDASLYKNGIYTTTVPNTATIVETTQSDDAEVDITCYQYATKAGMKFEDVNGSGAYEQGIDKPLKEWTIDLWTLDNEGKPAVNVATATTDDDGMYIFDKVIPGQDYLVCEALPDGWHQSYPTMATPDAAACPEAAGYAPYGYKINLSSAEVDDNNHFGNWQYATKAGMKFEDVNGSGAYEDGIDKPLKEWIIDLWTLDGGGQPLTKTASIKTDVDGMYTFDMIIPGVDYLVCEVLPDGWHQSYPTMDTPDAASCPEAAGYAPYGYKINLSSAEVDDNNHFGNWRYATKAGKKFEDVNGSGAYEDGIDKRLPDWTIDLWTLDSSGQPLTKTASMLTNDNGMYTFDEVIPGVDYLVCEVLPDGWHQSYPTMDTTDAAPCPEAAGYAPYGYKINLTSGEQDTNNYFGNWRYASKSGYKWHDLDEDGMGMGMNGEVPLSKWTIELWDVSTVTPIFVMAMTTNPEGMYSFDELEPGKDYIVCEVMEPGFYQTYPKLDSALTLPQGEEIVNCQDLLNDTGYGAFGYKLTAVSGAAWKNNNFGNNNNLGCTYTQGYWKTHANPDNEKKYDTTWDKLPDGPATTFISTTTGLTWIEAFNTPPSGGNAYIILAHQYMAAVLNSMKDTDPAYPDADVLAQAEYLLNKYAATLNEAGVPYIPKENAEDREWAIDLAMALDEFNNGNAGPSHCED